MQVDPNEDPRLSFLFLRQASPMFHRILFLLHRLEQKSLHPSHALPHFPQL